jgi:hypothetical protein
LCLGITFGEVAELAGAQAAGRGVLGATDLKAGGGVL